MAIKYTRIAAQVALRSNQLKGITQASLETAYGSAATLSAQMDGAEIPFSSLRDTVLAEEAKLVNFIGQTNHAAFRYGLYGKTVNLQSGTRIPDATETGKKFTGNFAHVLAVGSNLPLTEQPIQVIRRYLRNDYLTEIYNYAINAGRIYHTRPAVYLEGCVWDYAAAKTAFDTNGVSALPDALESTWIAGCLANLAQEGWFTNEANTYQGIYQNGLQMITRGADDVPMLPVANATAEPVAN